MHKVEIAPKMEETKRNLPEINGNCGRTGEKITERKTIMAKY